MSDVIEIPKANEAHSNYPCWVNTTQTGNNGEPARVRPHIICQCGKMTNIGNHHIHADGTITASYYHYYADRPEKMRGCGWHVYLKMIGWDGGEMLSGQEKVNP